MPMTRPWTKAEERKLIAATKSTTSADEVMRNARKALPERDLTFGMIQSKIHRLGQPRLSLTWGTNKAKVSNSDADEELARFAMIAKAGKHDLEELCDKFDASPKKIRELIAAAKLKGYRIDLTGTHVGYVPARPIKGERLVISRAGEEGIFAVASDIHIGSTHCREDFFVDFVKRAYDDGARTIFLPGDNIDGCYHHSRWEESHHGFYEQAKRMEEVFPRLPGLRYVGIIGNHEETFEKESGLSVVKALNDTFRTAGRSDLELLGARGAYIRFGAGKKDQKRGVLVELWHPMGGGAYALSYRMQKHVEGYAVGAKPDFLFVGHWHQQCYFTARGVHAFSSGTFHGGGGSFSKALGGTQAIGGWVVRYGQTKDGTVRDVQPTWRGYFESEQVRDLGLG